MNKIDANEMLIAGAKACDFITVKTAIKNGADNSNVALLFVLIDDDENEYRESEQIDIIGFLMENEAKNPNEGLFFAATHDRIDIAEIAIRHGADNLNECLCLATKGGMLRVIEIIIKSGANNLNKCLCLAAVYGQLHSAEILIKHGANNFDVALCYAGAVEEESYFGVADLLLEHIQKREKNNETNN